MVQVLHEELDATGWHVIDAYHIGKELLALAPNGYTRNICNTCAGVRNRGTVLWCGAAE